MKYIITDEKLKDQVEFVLKNKLGPWITKSDGLNLSKIIGDILYHYKTPISDDMKKKNEEGANILLNGDKIDKKRYDYLINRINNGEFVYDENGNWLPINKLNTNYRDISKLLADLLVDSILNPESKEIISKLVSNESIEDKKKFLITNKEYLKNLLTNNDNTLVNLNNYTSNIIKLSNIGETTENEVVKFLEKLSFVKLYQGGDGDLIDMLMSVDLIFEKDGKVWTFQVKLGKDNAENFLNYWKKDKGKYSAVDFLIYLYGKKIVVHNLRNNKVREYNN